MRQKAAALRDFSPLHVRFGSKADITRSPSHVRFTPESGHRADMPAPRSVLTAKVLGYNEGAANFAFVEPEREYGPAPFGRHSACTIYGPLHRGPISRPYPHREPVLIGVPLELLADPT